MIYEQAMDFEDLIKQVQILQGKFRIKKETKSLKEIIDEAMAHLQVSIKKNPDSTFFETAVTYTADPDKPDGPANKTVIYIVQFSRDGNKMVFESIGIHE